MVRWEIDLEVDGPNIFFGDEMVVALVKTDKSMRLLVREIVPVKTG